jgi:tRNA A-37 threonylcarbamoyl transferase component Bud32
VDLYVLERAILSTHSRIAEGFLTRILATYFGSCADGAVRTRLEAVRSRGRKRLAFG